MDLQEIDFVYFPLSASLYRYVCVVIQHYYGLITRYDHIQNGLRKPFTGESEPSRYA